MKQFTQQQVLHLMDKVKKDGRILDILDQAIKPVRAHYRIPQTALATWGGFFACPDHSVTLEFDISNPLLYRCPVDGAFFEGEPYQGAWWRHLNGANAEACHMAALRYMMLQEPEDLALARRILMDYARLYPGYEVHGGIPYNKPGKANAQALCDSQWLGTLARGYDIICGDLSEADRQLIERDLLRCGAEFLMEQRTDQLHNHECVVSAAIGIIGHLLGDERYIHFAVDQPYGFRYQLEHGVLRDGFWFEGAPSYHFYALEQYIKYERFAGQRPGSFFDSPRFLEALKFPMRVMQPDFSLTPLNDSGNNSRGTAAAVYLYEHAYARTGDEDFLQLLNLAYQDRPRVNLHAFFDGVDELPPTPPPRPRPYHAGEERTSGLTTLMGPDDRFLLVKHAPYGGEHDHYDRLGIHFMAFGQSIAPDMGTTQYGAPLHYAYYKNTVSHNTVCLNGQNQPPANCAVLLFKTHPDRTELCVQTRWDGSYVPLDSFVIKQWSDEAYEGAVLTRHITWYGDFFVDCYDVSVPGPRDIDWVLHVRGQLLNTPPTQPFASRWTEEGPGSYLRDAFRHTGGEAVAHTLWDAGKGIRLSMYTPAGDDGLYYALGPDNPSVKDLSYAIRRTHGIRARFLSVLCAWREGMPVIKDVGTQSGGLRIQKADGTEVLYNYPVDEQLQED